MSEELAPQPTLVQVYVVGFDPAQDDPVPGLMQHFGISATDARILVASVPRSVKSWTTHDRGLQMKRLLEGLGAEVELRPVEGQPLPTEGARTSDAPAEARRSGAYRRFPKPRVGPDNLPSIIPAPRVTPPPPRGRRTPMDFMIPDLAPPNVPSDTANGEDGEEPSSRASGVRKAVRPNEAAASSPSGEAEALHPGEAWADAGAMPPTGHDGWRVDAHTPPKAPQPPAAPPRPASQPPAAAPPRPPPTATRPAPMSFEEGDRLGEAYGHWPAVPRVGNEVERKDDTTLIIRSHTGAEIRPDGGGVSPVWLAAITGLAVAGAAALAYSLLG